MPERVRLSPLEIAAADAIVSLFETNSPAKYDAIARAADDLGGLSYGKHQAALVPGSLFELINQYCNAPGAQCADDLRPYLPQMEARDRALDHNDALVALLRKAANDPVMQSTQDDYFAEHYMGPALEEAYACGFSTPLACAVVYDSFVQGSWSQGGNIKGKTVARMGEPNAQNEKQWIAAYLQERRAWLAGHSNPLLPRTVYRMDTLIALVKAESWSLALPLSLQCNGYQFTLTAWDLNERLFPDPVFRVEPEQVGLVKARRAIVPEGRDKHVQQLLRDVGLLTSDRSVDGKFGSGTAGVVRAFQQSRGLSATGEVDAATYLQLAEASQQARARNGQGEELRPLPHREANGAGTAIAGAGGVAATGGVGAVIGAEVLAGGETSAPEAAPEPVQDSAGPEIGAVEHPSEAPAPIPDAPPTTEAAPPPAAPAPQPPITHTEIGVPEPAPAHWTKDVLPWVGIGLFALALILISIARRRAY